MLAPQGLLCRVYLCTWIFDHIHMAMCGKVLVGNNSNSAWIYGGRKVRFADPIECPLHPVAPVDSWGPVGPWGHVGPWSPWAHGAFRPAGGRQYF